MARISAGPPKSPMTGTILLPACRSLTNANESAHYFDNVGYGRDLHRDRALQAVEAHRKRNASGIHPVAFLEDRYHR